MGAEARGSTSLLSSIPPVTILGHHWQGTGQDECTNVPNTASGCSRRARVVPVLVVLWAKKQAILGDRRQVTTQGGQMTMPCGSVASCEPHDRLCWVYYPRIWGNGPHRLRVGFEKDVGSRLGKVTRHCLHRSTRPGCWAALHLQPSSVHLPSLMCPRRPS